MRKRGRLPRGTAPATCRLWLRLTPDERAALDRVSTETGMPRAAILREAVNEYVGDYSDRQGPIFVST